MAMSDAPFQMPGAPTTTPGCGPGCLCADPTWSCSGNVVLDGSGHAVGTTPEAGFLQIDTETYKAENVSRTSPRHRVWYSFQPAQSAPATKPLAVFFNGGPGAATTSILFDFNTAPMTLDPQRTGASTIQPNPYSWTQFANLLYIDAPGAGFSYPVSVNGVEPDVGIDIDRDAGMFVSVVLRFLIRHPALQSTNVFLVAESYGGVRAELMLQDLYNYTSLTNSSAPYNDAQVSADEAAYFQAVFGTATPTAAQLATKFNRQLLIEPVLVGAWQELETHPAGTGCVNSNPNCWVAPPPPALPACDAYDCDKQVAWSDDLEYNAATNLVASVATLNTALGVDATTIAWMYASQRTNVYDHFSSPPQSEPYEPGYCIPSQAMSQQFGKLAASNDCYLLTQNDIVFDSYGSADSWDDYPTGTQVGTAFANNLAAGVKTFVTLATFDMVVDTPAIPAALNDIINRGYLPILNDSGYNSTLAWTPPMSDPGVLFADYANNTTKTAPMPTYASGHSVTMRTPDLLFHDALAWYP
jgi:hypothetical protein